MAVVVVVVVAVVVVVVVAVVVAVVVVVVVVVAVVVAVAVIKQSIVTLNLFQGLPVGSFVVSVFIPSFHLFTTKNGPLG